MNFWLCTKVENKFELLHFFFFEGNCCIWFVDHQMIFWDIFVNNREMGYFEFHKGNDFHIFSCNCKVLLGICLNIVNL